MRTTKTTGIFATLALATLAVVLPATGQQSEVAKTWTDHSWTGSDGTVFHYLEQGEGTPVILIHGFTSSAVGGWFRREIALDMRGHGDTGPSPESSTGTMIGDVIEFLDDLGIERAHIGGYSMGGATTVGLMREIPERFITAAVMGIGVGAPSEEPPPAPAGAPRGAPSPSQPIDLTTIDFPVIAINGSEDRPLPKTEPMLRDLKEFTSVVISGRGHLDAPADPRFGDALAKFISANNP